MHAASLLTRAARIQGSDRPDPAELFPFMQQNKRLQSGRLPFIYMRAIGEAFAVREVEAEDVSAFLGRQGVVTTLRQRAEEHPHP